MKKTFYGFALLIAISALLLGCGYTTSSTLPSSIKTIHVEPFKNSIDYTTGSGRNIYLPLLEVVLIQRPQRSVHDRDAGQQRKREQYT